MSEEFVILECNALPFINKRLISPTIYPRKELILKSVEMINSWFYEIDNAFSHRHTGTCWEETGGGGVGDG